MQASVPTTSPVRIAPETFLIPNLAPAEPGTYVQVNSLLIRGEEPIIVDTGTPANRTQWLADVFSLVEPEDVRWIFLSHDDGDHTGGLYDALDACPAATLVTNFFAWERLALERPAVAPDRMIWRGPTESFYAGDRRLRLVVPPIFDAPTTRALYDERTGVLWAVDAFAASTPGAVHEVEEVPKDLYDESFHLFNSMISPWHEWLDPVVYNRHVDTVEGLRPEVVASAHGHVLRGEHIHDAFSRVRTLAGQPRVASPGQSLLDELIATVIAA